MTKDEWRELPTQELDYTVDDVVLYSSQPSVRSTLDVLELDELDAFDQLDTGNYYLSDEPTIKNG